MKNRYGFFCVCALLEVISLPCPAQVLETNAATGTSFYIENDVLSRTHKGDKWYTNGVRAVHLGDPKAYDIPADLATKLALFLCDYTFNCDPKQEKIGANLGVAFGQEIYTPANIAEPRPQPFDRPWAGWLYVGGIAQFTPRYSEPAPRVTTQQTLELDIGAVGQKAFTEQTQKFIHRIINSQQPQGWDNQIGGELGIALSYTQKLRYSPGNNDRFDIIPHYGFVLGNVHTFVNVGATARLGDNLTGFGDGKTPGPASKSERRAAKNIIDEWYVFFKTDLRGVARNIFLDGNTFRDSLSIKKHRFVYDVGGGVTVRFSNQVTLSYIQTRRSAEFYSSDNAERQFQNFGSLVVTSGF